MNIPEDLFDKIAEHAFNAISEADEEHKVSMRLVLVYEMDDEERAIVQNIELYPPPPAHAWPELFNTIAIETYSTIKRIPVYVGVVSAVMYARKGKEEVEDDEELLRSAIRGYMVVVSDVSTGYAQSRLYNDDLTLASNSVKNFSLFDTREISNFPPAAMMLAFNTRLLLEDSIHASENNNEEDLDDLVNTQTTIGIKKTKKGKFNVVNIEHSKKESQESDDDESQERPVFNPN